MQQISGYLRRAIDDFQMIHKGERVAVAVSGGKDSLLLLHGMKHLSRYHPAGFDLIAIFIDLGFDNMDIEELQKTCKELEIPLVIRKTDIAPVVFETRKESNPCSLCAKMRRGSLHDAALENGCRTIALGHHRDDAVETLAMNLIFEGRLACFQPVTYLDRMDLTVIRPLMYMNEVDVIGFVNKHQVPVVKSPCPADGYTKREYVKELLKKLNQENPGVKERMFTAIQTGNLKGWCDINGK